ncbi:MAG: hypothetical protein ACK4NY_23500 [Spirosomataceae bacterium]
MKTRQLPKILLAFTTACIMSYSFIACKDDGTLPKENQMQATKKIIVENGILKFVDQNHFEETFKQIMNNQNKEFFNKWENQFANFTSMKKAYESISEQDKLKIAKTRSNLGYEGFLTLVEDGDDFIAVRNTEHPIYAMMFNKDGLLIIGNNAYKLERTRGLIVKNYTYNKIQDLISTGKLNSDITVNTIVTTYKQNSDAKAKIKGISDLSKDCHDLYGPGNNRAFAGNFVLIGDGNWLFPHGYFNSVIVQARHRKRTLGIWFAEDATYLKVSGYFSGFNVSFNNDCSNCSSVEGVFWGSTEYGGVYGGITAEGSGYGGYYGGCSVSN